MSYLIIPKKSASRASEPAANLAQCEICDDPVDEVQAFVDKDGAELELCASCKEAVDE